MNKKLQQEHDSSFLEEKNAQETIAVDPTTYGRIAGTGDSFSGPLKGANYTVYSGEVITVKDKIVQWAIDRGLDKADPAKQMLKLIEEVGELASGIAKNKHDVIVDSIGDVVVVLTILSKQLGLDIDKCTEMAYNEIANRKGKLVNGVFVKEVDLNINSTSGTPDSNLKVKI